VIVDHLVVNLLIQTKYHLISTTLVSDVNYFRLPDVVRVVVGWIRRLVSIQRRLSYNARALVIGRRRTGSQCKREFGASQATGDRPVLLSCVFILLQTLSSSNGGCPHEPSK